MQIKDFKNVIARRLRMVADDAVWSSTNADGDQQGTVSLAVEWTLAIVMEETNFKNPAEAFTSFNSSMSTAESSGSLVASLKAQDDSFSKVQALKSGILMQVTIRTPAPSHNPTPYPTLKNLFRSRTPHATEPPTSMPTSSPSEFIKNGHFDGTLNGSSKPVFVQLQFMLAAIGAMFFVAFTTTSWWCYKDAKLNSQRIAMVNKLKDYNLKQVQEEELGEGGDGGWSEYKTSPHHPRSPAMAQRSRRSDKHSTSGVDDAAALRLQVESRDDGHQVNFNVDFSTDSNEEKDDYEIHVPYSYLKHVTVIPFVRSPTSHQKMLLSKSTQSALSRPLVIPSYLRDRRLKSASTFHSPRRLFSDKNPMTSRNFEFELSSDDSSFEGEIEIRDRWNKNSVYFAIDLRDRDTCVYDSRDEVNFESEEIPKSADKAELMRDEVIVNDLPQAWGFSETGPSSGSVEIVPTTTKIGDFVQKSPSTPLETFARSDLLLPRKSVFIRENFPAATTLNAALPEATTTVTASKSVIAAATTAEAEANIEATSNATSNAVPTPSKALQAATTVIEATSTAEQQAAEVATKTAKTLPTTRKELPAEPPPVAAFAAPAPADSSKRSPFTVYNEFSSRLTAVRSAQLAGKSSGFVSNRPLAGGSAGGSSMQPVGDKKRSLILDQNTFVSNLDSTTVSELRSSVNSPISLLFLARARAKARAVQDKTEAREHVQQLISPINQPSAAERIAASSLVPHPKLSDSTASIAFNARRSTARRRVSVLPLTAAAPVAAVTTAAASAIVPTTSNAGAIDTAVTRNVQSVDITLIERS